MISLDSTNRVCIAGLPGVGKTVLCKYLASLLEPRVLIYDPLSQYDNFPDECRYIPKSDSLEEFEAVCRKLCSQGNTTFIIEEAERYLGQGKPMGQYTFTLLNRGRNFGVGIFFNTRRIQRISKDAFDLAQHCFFFKCGLKSRGYIEDMVGRDTVRKIMTLPLYHFLHYNVETEESSVMVLKLGGARADVVTKEEEVKRKAEGESVKEGKVEELKPESKEEASESIQRRSSPQAIDTTQNGLKT